MRLVLQLTDDRIRQQYGIRCQPSKENIQEAFRALYRAVMRTVLPDLDDDGNIEWLDSKEKE